MESNWIKVITNNINLNKNKTEMNKTILRAVILLVAGAVLLCGCEKKESTPQKKYEPVNSTVTFVPHRIKCTVGDVIKPDIYVDYKKVENPALYNIKFTPCDPSVLSVNDQCEITVHKRDSAFVSLYCENNGTIYKDTMVVFTDLPSREDSYYIQKGFDLNGDTFLSVYEMSKVDAVDKWFPQDAHLLKNVETVYSCFERINLKPNVICDFSQNSRIKYLSIYLRDKDIRSCRIILPEVSEVENLKLYTDGWSAPDLENTVFPLCPNLDTLKIFYFHTSEFSIRRAEKLRYIHLTFRNMNVVDLSGCPNLNNLIMYDYGQTGQGELILAPQVYERYINKSQDFFYDISDDIVVRKAEN